MIRILVLLAMGAALLWSGGPGGRIEYVGGTLAEIEGKVRGSIDTRGDSEMVVFLRKLRVAVPYDRVNMLEYGQKVDRRYAMAVLVSPLLLLSKKRQHFLTIGYTDENGRQQAMIFRIDKDHVRPVLVSLEARTGRTIVYQDDEARKAGKG
jgi:hypothetical protein